MRGFRRVILVIFFLILAAVVAWEVGIRRSALPTGLNTAPLATPVVEDMRGRELAILPTETARECYPRPLTAVGQWLPLATVAIEDHRFWQHEGVDFHATTGAALRNLRNRRIISGASTITQQLVKLASGRTARTASAKWNEAFVAMQLERTWSKEQILEAYLDRLDYGNRRFGPEAAARAYFGKSARDLTLAEAIFLAGLPQSPARLNPWSRPEQALARYRLNVTRLASQGLLPAGTDAKLLLQQPPTVLRREPPNIAPAFVSLLRVPPATARWKTSLDLDLQRTAERLLQEHLASLADAGVNDAAVVIIDNATGEVRALASAGGPQTAAINAAVSPRSCGSTLKPFLYLDAIDRRALTAATLLPDTPEAITEEYRDYDPQNYSQKYLGPVRVREALGNSLNVPAVVAVSRMGARETFDGFQRWGLSFPVSFDQCGAGFILGNVPVRLLDLVGAYSAIARGGEVWKPKLTPRDAVESRRVASVDACAIVSDMMADNAARVQSFGPASVLNLDIRTPVKTGTSSGFRDGWCVGFSREHTVGVWAGNLSGRPMSEILAVRSAAPLWAALMRNLYENGDRPVESPRESPTLQKVEVAAETGLLPRPGEKTVAEWFLAGTAPQISAEDSYLDGVLQLPPEYAAWCAGPQNRLRAQVRSDKLAVLFPKEGAVFARNPTLPASQQMLPLRSTRSHGEWYLNGQKLREPLVPLEPGEWTISVRSAGEEAEARFSVE